MVKRHEEKHSEVKAHAIAEESARKEKENTIKQLLQRVAEKEAEVAKTESERGSENEATRRALAALETRASQAE